MKEPTPKTELLKVLAFHHRFSISHVGHRVMPGSIPGHALAKLDEVIVELRAEPADNLAAFRVGAMLEEVSEYADAHNRHDLPGTLDALVDLAYFMFGTVILQGFANIWGRAFNRVHDANMRKIRVDRENPSKRNAKFDIVKPEGWEPPYLDDLIVEDFGV